LRKLTGFYNLKWGKFGLVWARRVLGLGGNERKRVPTTLNTIFLSKIISQNL
jgi:hypothetical protein